MGPLRAGIGVLCAVAIACSSPAPFRGSDAIACLPPPTELTATLPALVDRADAIVLANVTRVEPLNNGHEGAARVTLRAVDVAKGTVVAEFNVYDAPCPQLAAKDGESYVLLLEGAVMADGTREVIHMPSGVLRATPPTRSLAQLMTEIRAVRPLDGDARALFERHAWNVAAKHSVDELTLPTLAEFGLAGREFRTAGTRLVEPFDRYAALSATVGLDPRPYAGQPAEILTFVMEGKPREFAEGTPLGHALIAQRKIVGAWVSVWPEHGVFSVRDRAAALAARTGPRAPFPPANRAPQGINIARSYDLAGARGIAFKTGDGRGGNVIDPARVAALARALDETLPTVQAIWDRNGAPTTYYIHVEFPTRYFSFEYDSGTGMITVPLDGYSVKAPTGFATFAAELR